MRAAPPLVLLLTSTVQVGGSPVRAGFEEPPTIVVSSAERLVSVSLEADEGFFCNQRPVVTDPVDCGRTPSSSVGPFNAAVPAAAIVGKQASNSSGQAAQSTDISIFSIRGSGSVRAKASLGFGEKAQVNAASDSSLVVFFTVPEGAPYTLSGTLKAAGEAGGSCLSGATVSLSLIHNHFVDCNTAAEDESFFFVGVALDSEMALAVEVNAFPSGDVLFDFTGEGTASFEFTLDFGDRDGDGLLDSWEEEGIDFEGPGIEIDLPGMGADPDKKDLFVEVDVMDGVAFDQQAIDDVILAFAQAPASMVNNPDGTLGIQLHVVVDGDSPGQQGLVLPDSGPPFLPPEFYSLKDSYFGSQDDRNHPDWNIIRQAKLLIFRYGLWADTVIDSAGDHPWGIAEAIPSNDFIVAAGRMQSRESLANVITDALAGTFMHELGHTLGLRHGGGDENSPNFKPNYLSLMNYSYTVPFDKATNQGTNAKKIWRLDFSRSLINTLDENEIFEPDGLIGPQGRQILFNSEAQGNAPKLNIGWANSLESDWNNNGTTEGAPYPLDLSQLFSGAAAGLEVLTSYTDWDRIWYHLSGDPVFNDRQAWPSASPAEGIYEEIFEAILAAEWVDQTALGDMIFANGFELGSTTAWSDTVP